jgi:hypothetical protein
MYNFVLHHHLNKYLLFELIVEIDEDLDDQDFDQNAKFQTLKLFYLVEEKSFTSIALFNSSH